MTAEEIAKQDGVKEQAIIKSIAAIDVYRAANTVEFLNESIVEVVRNNKRNLDKALSDGLRATKVDKNGKKTADHATQLKAFEVAVRAAEIVQPKTGKGISVNVNQQQAVASGSPPPESGYVGYEERLRTIRQKMDQHNLLPSATGTVIDDAAEIEDEAEEVTVSAGEPNTQG